MNETATRQLMANTCPQTKEQKMGAGAPATRRCGACVGADQRLGRNLRSGRVQILMR